MLFFKHCPGRQRRGGNFPPPENMVKSGDIVGHQKKGEKEKNATRLGHRTGPDNKELSGFYS